MKIELAIKYEVYLKHIGQDKAWRGSDTIRIIEKAFLAGAQASEEIQEEICIKLVAE